MGQDLKKEIITCISIVLMFFLLAFLMSFVFELLSSVATFPVGFGTNAPRHATMIVLGAEYVTEVDKYTYKAFDKNGEYMGTYHFVDCKDSMKERGFFKRLFVGWDLSKCTVIELEGRT